MTTVAEKLYPFQEAAIRRMEDLPNVFLFDEMGLGKSIQALEHVQRNNLKPCLIIAPKTLAWNWYYEIFKWYPDESPVFFRDDIDSFTDAYVDNKKRFFIIWHDVLARLDKDEVFGLLPELHWKSIIIDEAHLFRNPGIKRTENLLKFSWGKKIILTGTPIVNSALDLWPLIRLVGIDVWPRDFIQEFCYIKQTPWGSKPMGFRNKDRLFELLGGIWIRRTKAQVLKELPPKTYQKLIVEMPPDQRDVYTRLCTLLCLELDNGIELEAPEVLAMLTRLRQLALDPKILGKSTHSAKTEAIKDLVHNTTEKIVVYSNFRQYIDLLEKDLDVVSVRLTGAETPQERSNSIRQFQTNPDVRVMLATMQTGGLGVNLTAGRIVVIADQWWNKVRMEQAIDRLHRVGQTNKVLAITLHSRDSVDDHIDEIVQEKDATAREIIEAIRERGY